MYDITPILEHYGADHVPTGRKAMRCPFHDDSRASGSVDTERGLFNCHACGMGGDAIALLREKEGLSYASAVKLAEELAGPAGEEVPREPDSGSGFLPRRQGNRGSGEGFVPTWFGGKS